MVRRDETAMYRIISILLASLLPSAQVHGASYYYQFESTTWEYTGSGLSPFSADKHLSYSLLVDMSGSSYIDYVDPGQPDFYDSAPENQLRFYAEYLGGDSLGGTFQHIAGYHRGWSTTDSFTIAGHFTQLTVDNWLSIFTNSTRGLAPLRIDQWQIGTQTYFINRFFDVSVGATSDLQGYAVITGIQAVPLPTAAWMLASAIGLLGCVRRKKT